jgi:hypothetical protein
MSARMHEGNEWLRYHGSWPLLAAIVFLDPKTTWPVGFYAPLDRTVLE